MLPIIILLLISLFFLSAIALSTSLYINYRQIPISIYKSTKNTSNGLFLAFAIGLMIAIA